MASIRQAAGPPKKKGETALVTLPVKIPHAQVKQYCPPGTSVWRSQTSRPGWNGHCPPFQRTSATHKDFGEEQAPLVVLRRLWSSYLFLEGKDRSECPYKNMWGGPM